MIRLMHPSLSARVAITSHSGLGPPRLSSASDPRHCLRSSLAGARANGLRSRRSCGMIALRLAWGGRGEAFILAPFIRPARAGPTSEARGRRTRAANMPTRQAGIIMEFISLGQVGVRASR